MCTVNEFAGSYDVHLTSGQCNEWVGLEIHKVESDLGDFGDGAVPHEVRVRRGVQYVGLTVHSTCKQTVKRKVTIKGNSRII